MRRAGLLGSVSALALTLAGGGCARPSLTVVHDLAAELPGAELAGEASVILFGTPAAEAHQERGFSRAGAEEGERFVWVDTQAQVRLDWPEVRPRRLVLDVSLVPGMQRQSLELRLNRKRLSVLRVRSRERFLVDLPASAQKAGENRLTLKFGRAAEAGQPGTGRAARLHSLSVAAADGSLAAFEQEGALPVLESTRGRAPSLVHLSGLELRYAVRVPRGAELRTTPGLAPASQSPARLSILVEDAQAGRRELWGRALRPAEALPELRLGLAEFEGRLVRVVLRAEGDGPAWASWDAPRVMAPAQAAGDDPRAQALQASLRGANVVLVVLDAAGASHFSCYGYSRATTPEIDAIAAQAVLFERAYTPAVYTLGAMSALWTSRPPEECSLPSRGLSRAPDGPPTLAQRLATSGVHSAGFVASARAGPAYGLDRGFSEFHEVLTDGVGRAQALREAVGDWLQAAPPEPFLLYVHFREPHFPFDPPAPFAGRFGSTDSLPAAARRDQGWIDAVNAGRVALSPAQLEELVRLYDANLAYADSEVGALRKILEERGLWERSVFILTADHGEAMGEHGYIGHNKQVYDESAHVPLLLRFPRGRGPAGIRRQALTGLLDVAPTVAEIFGVEPAAPPAPGFAGTSLLRLASGATGRGFVVTTSATGARPRYAIRDERFTLIYSLRYARPRLFDAIADPGETRDVAEQLPFEASHARARLFLWLAELRREPVAESGAVPLTAEQRAQVRALGYVE